jgi:threonine dehydrogenase-like Zn-dependent dehydrogenase
MTPPGGGDHIEPVNGYILRGPGRAGWAQVPAPEPGPYDAIVRPTLVAVCTTDVHLIATAGFPAAIGKPIGHEAVGVVERVGHLVRDFKPGDRVIIPAGGTDWRHPNAQRGEAKYYQTNNAYFSEDPTVGGVFSELVRAIDVDMTTTPIPDDITDLQAVMVPDMVATGFTAVTRMNVDFGDTVVVLGVGPVGLMGIAAAALRGASRVIAVDSRVETAALARTYGATDLLGHAEGNVAERVLAITGGRPVDSVMIAAGGSASALFTTATSVLKPGGHVANVSLYLDQESVTLPLSAWAQGGMERHLTGVFVQEGREFYSRLLRLIQVGRLDPAPLVSHVLEGWDQLESAIDLMRTQSDGVIKPVVRVTAG